MSDLSATNCGCGCENSCGGGLFGGGGNNSCLWIILLLIFVFLMVLSGGTLMGLVRGASAPVKRLEEAYSSAVETRAAREEERQRWAPAPPSGPPTARR